mgnify:CR=1 FL=1
MLRRGKGERVKEKDTEEQQDRKLSIRGRETAKPSLNISFNDEFNNLIDYCSFTIAALSLELKKIKFNNNYIT